MPFGIPSEDFRGGFGLPRADEKFYMVDTESGENRGSVIIDPYDAKLEAAAEEVHDNLVRSLVEAGGTVREARELLVRSLEWLYMLGYDSGFTNPVIGTLTTDIKKFLEDTK